MFTSIRTRRLGVIGALMSAGIAGAVISGGGGASAQAPTAATRTIAFTEIEKAEPCCIADIAPKSRAKREPFMSPGDQLVFTQPLRGADGKAIGKSYAKCAAIVGAKLSRARYVCEGVYAFADGTLTTAGLARPNATMNGVVTGGTGAYANARGTFSSKDDSTGGDSKTVVTLVG